MLDESLLEEFTYEASELLDEAETSLLAIEKNENLEENFNSAFRVFHSLKGSAGMIGFESVQKHVHLIEDKLETFKNKKEKVAEVIGFFIEATDHTRLLLDGVQAEFDYALKNEIAEESQKSNTSSSIKKGELLLVDVIGIEIDKLVFRNELAQRVQFTQIKNLNEYIKRKSYFHTNAILITNEALDEFIKKSKDDIPVMVYDTTTIESKKVLTNNTSEINPGEIVETVAHSKIIFKSLYALEKAVKFIFYQYSDLEQYLTDNNRDSAKSAIQEEIQNIINLKGALFK